MIKAWLEKTIIGLDLCPFTQKPYAEGKILIEDLPGTNLAEAQNFFLSSLDSFQAQNNFQTALLVFAEWKINFRDFYDFLEDCEDHLHFLGLEEEYQLVVFHPDFCFEGLDSKDRANLVNSSPYPLIHILKTADLALLNLSPHDAESMSHGNARKLESLSEGDLKSHFPWRREVNV
jgi:uncharacterized protein